MGSSFLDVGEGDTFHVNFCDWCVGCIAIILLAMAEILKLHAQNQTNLDVVAGAGMKWNGRVLPVTKGFCSPKQPSDKQPPSSSQMDVLLSKAAL